MRRWRRIFRRDPADDVDEELRHHVDERVRDYIARGMEPESAHRAAHERLGDLVRVRAECTTLLAREHRARDRHVVLNLSWLDVKLGLRMLHKYPGLSLVSVIGMALAIAIGAGSFAFIHGMLDPTLPLEDGDRIVSIQNDRVDRAGVTDRHALHDFVLWRDGLKSVRDLGAYRGDSRTLVKQNGTADLVAVAEITASAFRVARVAPVEGRTLIDADERAGAPDVVVIAYEEWQRRFGGDPDIVGQSVRLGGTPRTVVGVMPEGFRFPVNHRYWIPLRMNPLDYPVGGGPWINVFGRLAEGYTMRNAQAELTAFGDRMAAAYPDTHGHLRPRVLPYALPFTDADSPEAQWLLRLLQLGISLLLVVVAVNVAVLIYARTTTRADEIAVRTALGASRRRIVAQLFVEALVLSTVAAVLGLAIAGVVLGQIEILMRRMSATLPFWMDLELSAGVVLYAAGLAILGGTIAGVLPALKATGRHVQAGLQQLSSRATQMQLGRSWTVMIVAQVAVAVAVLPAAIFYSSEMVRWGTRDPGYAADEFIRAWLSMEREESPPPAEAEAYERAFEARFAARSEELLRRLQSEPGVDATFAAAYPGNESTIRIEVEGAEPAGIRTAHVNHVGTNLFDMFDVPILAGRGFVDPAADASSVIVDRTFAESIAGGTNVVGRRIRHAPTNDDAPAPWFEIVGVVPDFPASAGPQIIAEDGRDSCITSCLRGTIHHVLQPGPAARIIVRTRRAPAAAFVGTLRDITASVDPALQLHEMYTVAESRRLTQRSLRLTALGIVLVTGSVLLLSIAGIYAMLAFTVARRRREIGIRSALGAEPRRILRAIFARAGAQLGTGIAIGLFIAIAAEWGSGGWVMGRHGHIILPIVASLIMTVGLLAALGPARRGLAIQPTEALREE
jgi:predicted permease